MYAISLCHETDVYAWEKITLLDERIRSYEKTFFGLVPITEELKCLSQVNKECQAQPLKNFILLAASC